MTRPHFCRSPPKLSSLRASRSLALRSPVFLASLVFPGPVGSPVFIPPSPGLGLVQGLGTQGPGARLWPGTLPPAEQDCSLLSAELEGLPLAVPAQPGH